jgi:hypothetical protein
MVSFTFKIHYREKGIGAVFSQKLCCLKQKQERGLSWKLVLLWQDPWAQLSILNWLHLAKNITCHCSVCALFKGMYQGRDAETAAMRDKPGMHPGKMLH